MPMGDVPSRAHQELDPEEHLVVFCHSGIRSMNVTVWLRNQGFEQVQSLRGGIDAWSVEVDPKVATLLGLGKALAPERVIRLEQAVIDPRIRSCSVVVREVMVAVFQTDRLCSGAIDFNSDSTVEGEVERA